MPFPSVVSSNFRRGLQISQLYNLSVYFEISCLHFSLLFKNAKEQDTCGTLLLRSLLPIFNIDSDLFARCRTQKRGKEATMGREATLEATSC